MSRLDTFLEICQVIRSKQDIISKLPKDPFGKPSNIELRKLIAVDPEFAFALASIIATIYFTMEHETILVASNTFERRSS